MGVEQPERAHDQIERDHGGDGRQHSLGEEEDREIAALHQLEAEAGERVGRRRAERQGEQGGAGRDQGRVDQGVLGFRHLQLVDPVVERRREIDPRNAEAGDGEGLERRAQAGGQSPVQREQKDHRGDDREQGEQRVAQLPVDRGRRVSPERQRHRGPD
jgi:hypothetical protein